MHGERPAQDSGRPLPRMYTSTLFTWTVYISTALIAFLLFSVSACILVSLPTIAGDSGGAGLGPRPESLFQVCPL